MHPQHERGLKVTVLAPHPYPRAAGRERLQGKPLPGGGTIEVFGRDQALRGAVQADEGDALCSGVLG